MAAASVVLAAAASVVGDAAAAVVVAAATGAVVVVAVLASLPHEAATIENEMIPARTSRRLTGFTYVSPWLGMSNEVTVKIEVDAQVVAR
jgi:hypothetical protein